MFLVTLTFGPNKAEAKTHMAGHNAWIQKGFDDGVFLVTGNLAPHEGGGVLAHGIDRETLEARLQDDPFVTHDVVVAKIIELVPGRTDPRLDFLAA